MRFDYVFFCEYAAGGLFMFFFVIGISRIWTSSYLVRDTEQGGCSLYSVTRMVSLSAYLFYV